MPKGEVMRMKCGKCGNEYVAQSGLIGSKLPRAGKCPKCGNKNKKLLVLLGAGTVGAIAAIAMSPKREVVHGMGIPLPDTSQQPTTPTPTQVKPPPYSAPFEDYEQAPSALTRLKIEPTEPASVPYQPPPTETTVVTPTTSATIASQVTRRKKVI